MSIYCNITLRWGATPDQLTALGTALWRWCTRSAGDAGIYQYLDNQALADLIAGRLPVIDQTTRPAERRGVHFRVRDGAFPDRRAAIDSLRREIPTEGVEDAVVGGVSWSAVASHDPAGPTV